MTSEEKADICALLGNIYYAKGNSYNRARDFYLKSLQIRKTFLPEDDLDIAEIYESLG